MNGLDQQTMRRAAETASQIASILDLLAEAFGADPALARGAEAVDGVSALARALSDTLFAMQEVMES